MQQNRVDHGKDRSIQAKAQRQRNHSDRAEAAVLEEHAKSKAQVFAEIIEPAIEPDAAAIFLGQRHVAKAAVRCATCFFGFHAVLQILRHLHVEMRANFVVNFARDLLPAKEGPEFGEASSEAHDDAPFTPKAISSIL